MRDNRKPCDSAASLRSLRWGCLFLPVLYKQPTTQPCKMTGMHRDVRLYLITVATVNLFICPAIDAKIVKSDLKVIIHQSIHQSTAPPLQDSVVSNVPVCADE